MGLFDMFKGGNSTDEISHDDLVGALQAKTVALVDVREPGGYAAGHVEGAVNVPLSGFDVNLLSKGKPVVLICRSGARSAQALAKARDVSKVSGLVDSVSLIALWRISVAAIAEKALVSWLKSSGSTPSIGQTHSHGSIETGPATTAVTAPSSMESEVAWGWRSVFVRARLSIH